MVPINPLGPPFQSQSYTYDSPKEPPDNRLHNVRSALHYFNAMMEDIYCIYSPHRELNIDESMILLWRAQLVFRLSIKTKCNRYGIKWNVLAEWTGLGCIIIYTVKTGENQPKGDSHAQCISMLPHVFI